MSSCLEAIKTHAESGELENLVHAVVLAPRRTTSLSRFLLSYEEFFCLGEHVRASELSTAEKMVQDEDVVNVQFTSGKFHVSRHVEIVLI